MNQPQTHSEAAGAKEFTCEACRGVFPIKRGWQRFCSTGCRNAYHHTMTPAALRKDIDAVRQVLAQVKADHEALKQRMDEFEAAAARVPA